MVWAVKYCSRRAVENAGELADDLTWSLVTHIDTGRPYTFESEHLAYLECDTLNQDADNALIFRPTRIT